MAKERAQYFTPAEQELLIEGYQEFQSLIKTQGNTAKAAKARREGWQKVADKLNTATTGPTRTWEQVKVKYKNILQNATKKRAEQQQTGGGPAPPRHTPAEELALGLNATRPIVEGIPGGSSSLDQQPGCSSSSTYITVPVSACIIWPECVSTCVLPCVSDCSMGDIRVLYKRSLQQKIEYTELKKQKLLGDIELQALMRQKVQLEIELLQKELQS
ncbi:nuclear receptor subfamily 1 group D member 2 [Sarotherodon galilaeus]